MKNFTLARPIARGSFEAVIAQAHQGDRIVLHRCSDKARAWPDHPRGIILQVANQLLLNGEELLYQGTMIPWEPHPAGVVVERDGALWLNGVGILYNGPWDDWSVHPQGLTIQLGDKLLLDGTSLICQGEHAEWCSTLFQEPIVARENQLLRNGKNVIYEGPWDDWEPHPQGVVIQLDDKLLLKGKEVIFKGRWNTWMSHSFGVAIEKDGKIVLVAT